MIQLESLGDRAMEKGVVDFPNQVMLPRGDRASVGSFPW
jgi:hypothetical protein